MFCLYDMSLLNEPALEQAPHRRHEILNKRRRAYSSKYGNLPITEK